MDNLILNTDSYKYSHPWQYPSGMTRMFSYLESRGGKYQATLFFGLQYILKRYLSQPVTADMVDEAQMFCDAHGVPFDRDGWMYIVNELGGNLPVIIRAVPEGTLVPIKNVLMTIESTDTRVPWVVGFIETLLLRVWYPITVATQSHLIKRIIKGFLRNTSDDADAEINFKLHDFGARGVSSYESAGIGGAAHLVNFMGSDTVTGILFARRYYGEPMAGFSIPAAEHSTITSWTRRGECDAYENMLDQFAKPGKIVAVVSDSYDLGQAVKHWWGECLKQKVIDSGATVVIRPDSGEPRKVVLETVRMLANKFGVENNAKGFALLPSCVRVIQGDGVDATSVHDILTDLTQDGFSASNVAFGMGGALLQQVNRDTLQFAIKCSSVTVNGQEIDVYKDPIGDSDKRSKRGRLDLIREGDEFKTVRLEDGTSVHPDTALQTVFYNGELLTDQTLAEIREKANESV